jgi:uncharacterized protein
MLYQLGPVAIDVFPFNVDAVERDAAADFARKDLLGRLPGREFVGEGDDQITLSGQLLPTKIGGLTELEAVHALRRAGERLMVLRGDGLVLGWFAIESVRESHERLGVNGVGQVVKHDIKLVRVTAPGSEATSLLDMLVALF